MSELKKNNDILYILNELGEDRNLYFNAISPPIIQTSNFERFDANNREHPILQYMLGWKSPNM